ncbi:RNA pseudouridylate synthase domain-containing protein 1-like [Lutzomyia longipalpis]|uniref:RNA pseudouridylate synthase domain-containing protein 1-like n=1 Tax=Lutzomyia longipalpis TaxID=7200 RepID=UPI002483F018|nr:RNA pseudouridylate synthase domain-containing protein 1-like [Lutzomyia longipalpis]
MLFYFDSFLQILGSTFLELLIEKISKTVSCILVPMSVDYPPLEVVFRSENFVAVFKPPDVKEVVLWECLHDQFGGVADRETQRGVFRRCFQADGGFSGLYPIAVNKKAALALKSTLTATHPRRRLHTYYVAIVRGLMEQPEIRIDAPIGRDLRFKTPVVRMCTSTDWEHCYSPCECTTQVILVETGYLDGEFASKVVLKSYRGDRKHQFRVHLKEIGHPLVGDTLYDELRHPFNETLMIQLLRLRAESDVERLWVETDDPYAGEKFSERWRIKDSFLHLQDALEKLDSLETF